MGMITRPDPTEIYLLDSGDYRGFSMHNGIRSAKSAALTRLGAWDSVGPIKLFRLVDNAWVLEYDLPKIRRPLRGVPLDWEKYKVDYDPISGWFEV